MIEGPYLGETRPRSTAALAAWLREHLDLHVPTRPLIPGHAAPFDYLCHAYFEGDVPHERTDAPESDPARNGRVRLAPPADCVVWANRGGGKTYLAAVASLLDLVFKPGIEIRVLAGSLEQAGRMHAHLAALLERPGLSELVDGKLRSRGVRLHNGSGLELLAQSQASVRGTRVQKLRCDEVELFDPDVWEAAQLVTRSADCGGVKVRGSIECLSTMHVPYGLMRSLVADAIDGQRALFKWGVVDVLGACDDDAHVCQPPDADPCPLWESCAGRAKARDAVGETPGHLHITDAITQMGRVAPQTWRAEMLCLEPRRSDCVFPEFDAALHVVDELPAGLLDNEQTTEAITIIGGMDFGFRSPTVYLWAAVDAEDRVWVFDAYSQTATTIAEHIAAVRDREWPAPAWIGVDPAGRQRSRQTGVSDSTPWRRAGFRVRDRSLGTQQGLAMVRARLATADGAAPRLLVHRRCEDLIRALTEYHYPADRPESLDPVKDGPDHAVDALRYMIQNLDTRHETKLGRY
jgi:hypothetical protein